MILPLHAFLCVRPHRVQAWLPQAQCIPSATPLPTLDHLSEDLTEFTLNIDEFDREGERRLGEELGGGRFTETSSEKV